MDERSYWLGFSLFSGIGPGRFTKLLTHFGSAKNAWEAHETDLVTILKPALTKSFLAFRKEFSFEDYLKKMHKANVSFLTLEDKQYPQLLKTIKNPPFVSFYKGNKEILNSQNVIPAKGRTERSEGDRLLDKGEGIQNLDSRFHGNDNYENVGYVGIVGTRKITDYGRAVTEKITRELVESGCVIVSGLALGVDTIAHQTTIDAHGKTIAVLGCGIDCCYPRENQRLYDAILAKGGVIVSEYGLGFQPTKGSFPSRNRIIAGLSLGTLVTEGASDSGALITAKDALANNRRVFAVPGPVTSSLSQGTYQLIKQGAVVVGSGKEILEELQIRGAKRAKGDKGLKGDTKEEQKILDLLREQDVHIDELAKRTGIASAKIGGILSLMEMKGLIKSQEGGFFALAL